MPLFQNSVLKKQLKAQDNQAVKTAYQHYTAYFHHPEIQQNIRDAKEEQFQEGFLRELFVKILGKSRFIIKSCPRSSTPSNYGIDSSRAAC